METTAIYADQRSAEQVSKALGGKGKTLQAKGGPYSLTREDARPGKTFVIGGNEKRSGFGRRSDRTGPFALG